MNQKRIFWMVLLLLTASLDISLVQNLKQNHGVYQEKSQLLEEEEALAQLRAFMLPQDAAWNDTKQKDQVQGNVEDQDQVQVNVEDQVKDQVLKEDKDEEKTSDDEDEENADVSWKFSFGSHFDLNDQKHMSENILAYLFCQTLDADELEQWKETEQDAALQLYEDYTNYVQCLLADAVYFPVPEAANDAQAAVSYENSWQSERTYGGARGHEGCDLMASVQQRGYYPVVSVSDGVVEKIGWLPQGGYRIGIRSRHGVYYYYAHLAEYENGMEEGVSVAAGQLLGYMGDTGYSEVEGTTGNFPVHLHFGMYLDLEGRGEVSFNPYYLLKLLEKNKLQYTY